MTTTPRETELKFALAPEGVPALAARIPALAAAPARNLVSVYYDTPKRALKRAGFALRVRDDAGRYVQTLKRDGDDPLTRDEWEAPLKDAAPSPALLADTPARRALAKGGPLAPQFEVANLRRSAVVREGESVIELSLDQAEARADGKAAPFAELELELKEGPVWGLLTLARKLAQGGDLALSFTTKAERGAALAHPPRLRARRFKTPKLAGGMSAGEAFRVVARACLRQIVENAEALRQRPSPEVIHQLRVALRRLRSLATTFKDLVSDARLPALSAELKWLTGELDAARNLDVLLHGGYRQAVVEKAAAEGLKGLGSRLRDARRLAYARAASAAEGERCRRLLLDLLIWIEEGAWAHESAREALRSQPIEKFARRALTKRRRRLLKHGRDIAALDPRARHKLRIDAKKLRYAAEVFAALFDRPRRTRRFVNALKVVQDQLGELNDIVVGETLAHDVATAAGLGASEAAFAAGRITGARKAQIDARLVEAQDALGHLAKAKPFWPA